MIDKPQVFRYALGEVKEMNKAEANELRERMERAGWDCVGLRSTTSYHCSRAFMPDTTYKVEGLSPEPLEAYHCFEAVAEYESLLNA